MEIIINDNRMVLRIQRLPPSPKEEWEPPCDCLPGGAPQKTEPQTQRVITAAPIPPHQSTNQSPPLVSSRPIDLVDNPNMFLLKIRKRSETSDRKRENLDLEFRTPRPWLPKPPEKRKKSFREEYEEQKENQAISEDNVPPTKQKKSKKGKK
ncbi:uncharacterized protein [Fopius arisanus]|uniref:Uncharacterized protein n=1 Tax=Fopius arisanus TaxID=64838 RepID=A0A9R1SZU7_9HYME|nr:PREDICTED: uncharacterized protein LOC105264803 [Fopius arisanus]